MPLYIRNIIQVYQKYTLVSSIDVILVAVSNPGINNEDVFIACKNGLENLISEK